MKSIGEKIDFYRERAVLSCDELAKKAKVDPSSMSQWINGKRKPTPRTLKKIANALEINVKLLIDDDHEDEISGSDIDLKIGNNLRKFRKAKGMTLQEVSSIIGCSLSNLSNIEAGKQPAYPEVISKIDEITGTSVNSIFGEYSPSEIEQANLSKEEKFSLNDFALGIWLVAQADSESLKHAVNAMKSGSFVSIIPRQTSQEETEVDDLAQKTVSECEKASAKAKALQKNPKASKVG
jgi:transcriptional regulator with XRE-family HTH domain